MQMLDSPPRLCEGSWEFLPVPWGQGRAVSLLPCPTPPWRSCSQIHFGKVTVGYPTPHLSDPADSLFTLFTQYRIVQKQAAILLRQNQMPLYLHRDN